MLTWREHPCGTPVSRLPAKERTIADFLEQLSAAIESRRDDLDRHLRPAAAPGEADLERLVGEHWSPLPPRRVTGEWPAYAIDGSIRQLSLDNGCSLIIVQALCLGQDAFEEATVDLEILPPSTPRSTASRLADLIQRQKELYLACERVAGMPAGGVLFLDGALYGLLPQLYPVTLEDSERLAGYPELILANYLELLETARERGVHVVAVSKTSHEATHFKLWSRARGLDGGAPTGELTDSAMIHRWTDRAAGVSMPVVLGTWGFTGGSSALLEDEAVRGSPAIVSFFVRLADLDDALRIDVPAHQVGATRALGDLDGDVLAGGVEALGPMLDLLAADYGGLEVYNALLYSVDREVRLKRDIVTEVYLPLIRDQLGCDVRLDRSERRF